MGLLTLNELAGFGTAVAIPGWDGTFPSSSQPDRCGGGDGQYRCGEEERPQPRGSCNPCGPGPVWQQSVSGSMTEAECQQHLQVASYRCYEPQAPSPPTSIGPSQSELDAEIAAKQTEADLRLAEQRARLEAMREEMRIRREERRAEREASKPAAPIAPKVVRPPSPRPRPAPTPRPAQIPPAAWAVAGFALAALLLKR